MRGMAAPPARILVAYSPADRFAADTVTHALQGSQLACTEASAVEAGAVAALVEHAQVLLVLHSKSTTADAGLLRVTEAAAARKLPMLVVRLDTMGPTPALKNALRSVPWVDAAQGKLPERLNGIVVRVKQLAGIPLDDADAVDDGEGGIDLWSIERRKVPRKWIVVGVIVLAAIAVLAWRAYDRFAAEGAYDRGVARLAEGDLPAAEASLADAVQRRPEWGAAWRQRGFASRDPAAQVTFFARAIQLDPADADALAGRARAYARGGDLVHARSDLTAALQLAPDSADWLGERGLVALLQNDEAAAAADFQRCAKLDARCATSYGARIAAVETAQGRTPRDWFAPP
jgi:hypothetical protein